MEIKTYRADSMQEAIALVRRELGPDASILHTRKATGGVLGWLGGRQIEVTATADMPVPSRIERSPAKTPSSKPRVAPRPAWAGTGEETIEEKPVAPKATPADSTDFREAYRNAVKRPDAQAPSVVEQLSGNRSAAKPARSIEHDLHKRLTQLGFSTAAATELFERVIGRKSEAWGSDLPTALASIQYHLAQRIKIAGPIQRTHGGPHVVAIVGPTGVGKTTTVAKLAAQFRIKDRLQVGLVTDDIDRLAAVERLRSYANSLDLPVEVATTSGEMQTAMTRLANADIVLIDTAGHSPRDADGLKALRTLLRASQVHEVHLAVSAAASEASLRLTAERFATVGVDRLLLTKLDESIAHGGLYPMLTQSNLPVGYLTHGQNVPHDIRPASSALLADLMINGVGQ